MKSADNNQVAVAPAPPGEGNGSASFYAEALGHLLRSEIPFLVGGQFAFARYVHIERHTKDLDLFVRPEDVSRVLQLFASHGYRTELLFPHWLGKVYSDEGYIDVIFSSGNGVARVDDEWFVNAVERQMFGLPVHLCPPEEIIWSKAFVQERERFDGADVLHFIRESGHSLDWPRLLERFGEHWRVLLAHIVTFGFVYPAERDSVPKWVVDELMDRFAAETSEPSNPVCNGTLLSREQYLHDLENLGYQDARVQPRGRMTREEISVWTEAIAQQK